MGSRIGSTIGIVHLLLDSETVFRFVGRTQVALDSTNTPEILEGNEYLVLLSLAQNAK